MGNWLGLNKGASVTENCIRTVDCSVCYETLALDHGGINCVQGHHLCLERCSVQFVDTVLEEPVVRIPVKCPICGVLLNDDVLQRAMKPEQVDKYQFYYLHLTANKTIGDGEVFCMCPFCQYFEYRVSDENEIVFIRCKNPSCKKVSCFICKLPVDVEDDENIKFHMKCSSLRELKCQVEQVLALGNTVPCPYCGLSGMKDDHCSHISCPTCKTHWCYTCGKTLALPGSRVGNNVYGHFFDWQRNVNNCPMYLQNLHKINKAFPNDARGALQKFHQNRSLMLLKGFVDKIGVGTFKDLSHHFEAVQNCGFSFQEIQNAPNHVFRPNTTTSCVIQ